MSPEGCKAEEALEPSVECCVSAPSRPFFAKSAVQYVMAGELSAIHALARTLPTRIVHLMLYAGMLACSHARMCLHACSVLAYACIMQQ